jgi:hypothetical protein
LYSEWFGLCIVILLLLFEKIKHLKNEGTNIKPMKDNRSFFEKLTGSVRMDDMEDEVVEETRLT